MEKRRVALTGSGGFIGCHLMNALQKRGHVPLPIYIDLSHPETLDNQMQKLEADSLIHLAWETTHGLYWSSDRNLSWVRASLTLAESFIASGGKRLLIAGTCAQKDLSTLYGSSKEATRLCLSSLCAAKGVSFGWGEIFFPYGPFEKKERFIPSLILHLLQKKPFTCSSPDYIRDFLFVEELAEGFVHFLDSTAQGSLEIGSGIPTSMRELTQTISSLLGEEALIQFGTPTLSPANPPLLVADTKRLNHEVGFTPKLTLKDGLCQTISWWKKMRITQTT